MSDQRWRRTLWGVVGLGVCNHVVLSGARVAVSLDALRLGASPAIVGLLMALFALLPMLLAVHAGRYADRVGARTPMRIGSLGAATGVALPALLPGLASLFAAAALIGAAFMLFQVAAQRLTGELGGPADRAGNYGTLALGYSISGFAGPLASGIAIDRLGFASTFALLALAPLVPLTVLGWSRFALPRHVPTRATATRQALLALLAVPPLRRLLAINALFALGWDLHTIFVPIYGARIGLSAAQIGLILSAFAAATFVVRFSIRTLSHHTSERSVLTVALLVASIVYLVFPFSRSATMLMILAFVLGLGLGAGQPVVMALLHAHAPDGRMGEAAGLRMALIQAMSVTVPLVFGALGSSLGLLPVFWTVGFCLAGGSIYARRFRTG